MLSTTATVDAGAGAATTVAGKWLCLRKEVMVLSSLQLEILAVVITVTVTIMIAITCDTATFINVQNTVSCCVLIFAIPEIITVVVANG